MCGGTGPRRGRVQVVHAMSEAEGIVVIVLGVVHVCVRGFLPQLVVIDCWGGGRRGRHKRSPQQRVRPHTAKLSLGVSSLAVRKRPCVVAFVVDSQGHRVQDDGEAVACFGGVNDVIRDVVLKHGLSGHLVGVAVKVLSYDTDTPVDNALLPQVAGDLFSTEKIWLSEHSPMDAEQ